MAPVNIFIHWLNKNSYMGDKNINNTKKIEKNRSYTVLNNIKNQLK